ncbi:MAG TPA: hypothetical protein VJ483_03745 [Holophagaceae bacterium]|nr:hypothetical protein [Holophagaceae bacterium]
MKKLAFACLLPLCFSTAHAQVSLHIDIGLPLAPPLVEIQPGIRVVEGFDDEVFFYNGWYWCRRPDGWYRARSPRSPFGFIDRRRVPRSLVRVPEGRYRNWHRDEGRHEGREERREEGRGHGEHGGHGRGEGHGKEGHGRHGR